MKTLLCLACTDEALTVLHTSDQGKCLKEIEFSMQAQIPFLARAVGVPVGRRSGLAMTLVATIFIVLFFFFLYTSLMGEGHKRFRCGRNFVSFLRASLNKFVRWCIFFDFHNMMGAF